MANFGANFLAGRNAGREYALSQQAEQRDFKLNALAGQAYAANPADREGIIGQAVGVDAERGMALGKGFESGDDRRQTALVNASRLYLNTPPQFRGAMVQRMAPDLQRYGLNVTEDGPELEQAAKAFVASYGANTASELPSEIRTLEYLKAHPELMGINDQLRGTESFQKIINADGTVSYVALNNRTGAGAVAPVGGPGQPAQPQQPYAPPQPQPSPGLQMDSAEQVILKIEEQDGPLPPDVRQKLAAQLRGGGAFDVSNPSAAPQPQPAVNRQPTLDPIPYDQYGGGPVGGSGLGESNADRARAAANQARQVKSADIETELAYADRVAEAAAKREGAITSARSGATNQAEREAVQRTNNTAFAQYTAARDTLLTDLAATSTGPIAGRLPAVTEGQQIAEGAQARMAPILKGLFRTAGEGTFTDKDQALLMAMVPTRTDLPGAVKAKMAGIDAIIEAKLQQGGGQSAQQGSPPANGPQPGQVEDGFRFKGGNASDPNSWERV